MLLKPLLKQLMAKQSMQLQSCDDCQRPYALPFNSCACPWLPKEILHREKAMKHAVSLNIRENRSNLNINPLSTNITLTYISLHISCPVLWNDQTLGVMKNGQGPEALFRIQMFKFVGSSYTDVFLHCNVQICHNTGGVCQPVSSQVITAALVWLNKKTQ